MKKTLILAVAFGLAGSAWAAEETSAPKEGPSDLSKNCSVSSARTESKQYPAQGQTNTPASDPKAGSAEDAPKSK